MKAIVISEKEFDLIVDKLKRELVEALDREREREFFGSPSKTVTYYVESFRNEVKE